MGHKQDLGLAAEIARRADERFEVRARAAAEVRVLRYDGEVDHGRIAVT
jgi:hypothetical protein